MGKKIHNFLFVIAFMACLLAPVIQVVYPFFEEPPLGGAAYTASIGPFTGEDFWSGRYLKGVEDWYGENFGFRKLFVRAENQFNYSVFGDFPKMYRNQVMVGRDSWLFQSELLPEKVRARPFDVNRARLEIWRMRRLQDYMDAHGTPLIFIIAPIKSSVFPEMLPPSIMQYSKPERREFREIVIPLLDEFGVRYIDSVAEALRLKESGADFQLFAPEGTHWTFAFSAHVMQMAADELRPLMKNPFPEFDLAYSRVDAPVWSEFDLRLLANLTFSAQEHVVLNYPSLTLREQSSRKPNIALVGDSYCWNLMSTMDGFFGPDKLVEDINLYYYFNTLYEHPSKERIPVDPDQFDLTSEILTDRDALLIVTSESALFQIGFGLLDSVFRNE